MADHAWKRFERRVAEGFSRWLSGGKSSQVLARQSLLGRMVERLHGDLAPHPDCPEKYKTSAAWFMSRFQIDAKRRKAFSIESVLHQPAHQLWSWWAKLTEDTAQDKYPVLVLVAPRGGAIVVYDEMLNLDLLNRGGSNRSIPEAMVWSPYGKDSVLFMRSFDLWVRGLCEPQVLGCPSAAVVNTPTGKGAVI